MPLERSPEPSGFLDSLFEAIGRVVEDIRHKVVEEGWFGRQVTGDAPPNAAERLGWDMPKQSFDELWAPAERDAAKEQDAPERDGPGMDL